MVQEAPPEDHPVSIWQFSCLLACDAQTVQVALVVTAGLEGGKLMRFSAQFGDKNPLSTIQNQLLKELVGAWHCKVEKQRIAPSPTPLTKKSLDQFANSRNGEVADGGEHNSGEWVYQTSDDPLQEFVETVLISSGRRLPVVIVAEDEELVKTIPDAFEFASPEALKKFNAWWLTRPNGDLSDRDKYVNLHSKATQQRGQAVSFPEFLQSRLLGHAQVSVIDRSGADRLAQLLDRDRTVESPGLRIYWPGFTQDTPITECPNYGVAELSQLVRQRSVEPIERILHDQMTHLSGHCFREGHIIRAARAALAIEVAATRRWVATLTKRLPRIETEAQEARNARERFRHDRDALQRQLEAAQREVVNLRTELLTIREQNSHKQDDEFAAELERSWDENARLKVEIEAGRKREAKLAEDLLAAQENLAALWQSPSEFSPEPLAVERSFGTVAAALSAAATDFADILVIWEDAFLSADQSLFANPDQVYRALQAIVEVGREYFSSRTRGTAPGPLDRAFQKRIPFKYTGFESPTTMSMYGAERMFHHGGLSRQMQRHITLGGGQTNNCLQIFFEFDDMAQRVFIGYCGRHLPYASQRT